MNLVVSPSGPLHGDLAFSGDKSISHRAALFSTFARGGSRIENFLAAGVTRAMLEALGTLGIPVQLSGTTLLIESEGLESFQPSDGTIDCGNSATTMRLLAGALAAAGIPAILDGSPGLRRRPMQRIVTPLQEMGVPIEAASGGCPPLILGQRPAGRSLRSIHYELPEASAQVKTAILLAGLAAEGQTTIVEPAPSRDHSERLLGSMGVRIDILALGSDGCPCSLTLNPPGFPLRPINFRLPGDFSSAAFFIVAALITPGSQVSLRDVGINPTRLGLLDVLQSMGACIEIEEHGLRQGEPVGDIHVRYSPLKGTEVSGLTVVRMIDEFPAFAVAAISADGPTLVRDAEELRYKESDRITALCQGLQSLGSAVEELRDGFRLPGQETLHGGRVKSCGDHRLAMSFAIAGLVSEQPVEVQGAEIIKESFPNFVESIEALGADIYTVPERVP